MFAYVKTKQKPDSKSEIQKKEPDKTAPNMTGIPDSMKTRFESLSGFSFDDVRVNYTSDKPAQLQALAYTQGNQIHIAPGQEMHLTHELGHVVQQKLGIVSANTNKFGVPVNDNPSLEENADNIFKSSYLSDTNNRTNIIKTNALTACAQLRTELVNDKLNVAGENHSVSGGRRPAERVFCTKKTGSGNYWEEYDFRLDGSSDNATSKAPRADRTYMRIDLRFCEFSTIIGNLEKCKNDFETYKNNNWWTLMVTYTFPACERCVSTAKGELEELNALLPDLSGLDGLEVAERIEAYNQITAKSLEILTYITTKLSSVDFLGIKVIVGLLDTAVINNDTSAINYYTGRLQTYSTAQMDKALELIAGLKIGLEAIAVLREPTLFGALTNRSSINKNRSDVMHEAAKSNFTKKGVWKIGESHRNDIKDKTDINYNLVSKDDFDIAFEEWVITIP